ncbi:uncharacterized protein BCR38DRAFT_417400, partial [Pseudomassariella vexata]
MLNGATGGLVQRLPLADFHRFLHSRLRAFMAEDIQVTYDKRPSHILYSEHGRSATCRY